MDYDVSHFLHTCILTISYQSWSEYFDSFSVSTFIDDMVLNDSVIYSINYYRASFGSTR